MKISLLFIILSIFCVSGIQWSKFDDGDPILLPDMNFHLFYFQIHWIHLFLYLVALLEMNLKMILGNIDWVDISNSLFFFKTFQESNKWTEIEYKGSAPPKMQGAVLIYRSIKRSLVLFGGLYEYKESLYFNKDYIWEYYIGIHLLFFDT